MTVTLLVGDCRSVLRDLNGGSVHCAVTSPPYFGLRDYGVEGQIGLEDSLQDYIDALVGVFAELRRVLRDDGTLWLNLGDAYAGSWGSQGYRDVPAKISRNTIRNQPKRASGTGTIRDAGLKPKDLMLLPARVALALQADGWYLRSEVVWHKPNPMPESVADRPTSAHEKLFLFSKSLRYHYDADAVKVTRVGDEDADGFRGGSYVDGKPSQRQKSRNVRRRYNEEVGRPGRVSSIARSFPYEGEGRNLRNVWTVATRPFNKAHFATFPPELIEPCIKAGCPEGGTVLDPFGGAGTTGLVADRLRRNAVLIELNPTYAEIARRRLQADGGMFAEVKDDLPAAPFEDSLAVAGCDPL